MADALSRFVDAQHATYPQALAELARGRKTSHWMWYVFPQIAGLGRSDTARFYAIADAAEARAYLAHPVLGPRLIEATRTICTVGGKAEDILGSVDAMKLKSSMTLFAAVADDPVPFNDALARFFGGTQDAATIALLGG